MTGSCIPGIRAIQFLCLAGLIVGGTFSTVGSASSIVRTEMKTDILVTVVAPDTMGLAKKIETIEELAAAGIPPVDTPAGPPIDRPGPPSVKKPYFDIGDGEGKPGDVVELVVEAGCRYLTNGFHIGGGVGLLPSIPRSGYNKFKAVGVELGSYLTSYFKSVGGIEKVQDGAGVKWVDNYWSIFQFVATDPHRSLPEEWWEYSVGFFSISKEKTWDPVVIPSGTGLFTLKVEILPDTEPGEYLVTCRDEHYYTNSRPRRRDFLFTAGRDSEFARGGITKLELFGGKITVTA